jgi:dolichol-phosphate mannosyltransferase
MQKLSLASDVIIVFSNIGLHIAILFSSIFALISIFIGIYALIAHYIDKAVISGWTTTMLFLSVGFTGIFVTLSIIAKYISTILLEQRHSNLYTPESLERLNK